MHAVDGENHSTSDGALLTVGSTFAVDRVQERMWDLCAKVRARYFILAASFFASALLHTLVDALMATI